MQTIQGISTKVDSCAGLISQAAFRAHQSLKPEHKRWIDAEDMLQDALLEAVQAEKRYKESAPAKYSTYLHRGLFYCLRKNYYDRFQLQKRNAAAIIEIDAPKYDDGPIYEVVDRRPVVEVQVTQIKRAVNALEAFCRAVSPATCMVTVRGLLFGETINLEQKVVAGGRGYGGVTGRKMERLGDLVSRESAVAVQKLGIQWEDFGVFAGSEKSRKMALIQLLRSGIIGSTDTDARLLECIGCSGRFTLSDVRDGRFTVLTMTCRVCYQEMAEDPGRCFGKTKTTDQEGYSDKDVECRLHCLDRKVCGKFTLTKGDKVMAKKAVKEAKGSAAVEELDDVEFDEVEDVAPVKAEKKPKGKSGKADKAKAVTAEKPEKAKAKKAVKEEDVPEDVVEWPYRAGSLMRWIWQSFYNGIKRSEFESQLTQNGHKPEKWITWMRRGANGLKKGRATHTWKVNEEGGRFKLHAVKYVGDKAEGKKKKAKAA